MVSKVNTKSSIYGDYILGQVLEIGRAGGGEYILIKLADKMGLPITGNLRKRLFTMQSLGLLTIGYKTVGGRGVCYNYIIHPQPSPEKGIDFIPF